MGSTVGNQRVVVDVLMLVAYDAAVAGALVLQGTQIGPHELWGGVPAKFIKMAREGMAQAYADHYVGYAKEFLKDTPQPTPI